MWGANPDELRAVGRRFARSSSGVTYSARSLDSEVMAVQWLGRDADRFRSDWFEVSEWMRELALHLDEIETELERQAAEQDAASAADGRAFGKASARAAGGTGFSLGSLAGSLMGASDGDDRPDPSPQPSPTPGPYPDDSSDQEPPVPLPAMPIIAKRRADYSWEEEVRRQLEALEAGNDPHAVAAWFRDQGLDPADPEDAERLREFGRLFPDEIGNLEGAPYVARDAANQTVLDREIAERTAELQRRGDSYPPHERERLEDLLALRATLNNAESKRPRSLVELHADGYDHVQASVATGNLDTASSVTMYLPGMDSRAAGMEGYVKSAEAILGAAQQADQLNADNYATITNLNFDSPKGGEVLSNGPAANAAGNVQNDLDGLNAARDKNQFELNIVGYSYGSNVVHHALTGQGDRFGVDRVYYVGSAGLPHGEGASYDYGSAQQYATEADTDPYARKGRDWYSEHQTDPRDLSEFEVYDCSHPSDGTQPSTNHEALGPGGYFNENSKNTVVIGEGIAS